MLLVVLLMVTGVRSLLDSVAGGCRLGLGFCPSAWVCWW